MHETRVRSLGQGEDPLEKEMATHSGTLAWKIPWTEKPVGYCLWWATVYGVPKSWIQLSTLLSLVLQFYIAYVSKEFYNLPEDQLLI